MARRSRWVRFPMFLARRMVSDLDPQGIAYFSSMRTNRQSRMARDPGPVDRFIDSGL
jgi:hypothetical protein